MSVRFECPACGAAYRVFDQAVGHRLRCPSCDELVDVTAAPELEPSEEVSADEIAADQAAEPLSLDLIEEVSNDDLAPLPPAPPTAGGYSGENYPAHVAPPVVWGSGDVMAGATPHIAQPAATGGTRSRGKINLRPPGGSQESEMDMTPMVDVTFLLLIFFMVTASFTMQKSLNIPKPESDEPSTQAQSVQDFQDNPEYVVVRVDAYNTYHISTAAWPDEIEAPSEQELLVKLRQAREGDAQGNIPSKLLVIANIEALHERVVTAIDAGNDVGMDEVQLLTVEEDEG
ncbi:MAG: biopolymer transporter ExbD [Pirellulaceae bacterium]|nr:biopolymer transporter ExbD [Pirellulaceae bacterium]